MNTQLTLMKMCKEKTGDNNLAHILSELLHINLDAAYRRIRGTTPLTLDEVTAICHHFQVSMDAVMAYKGHLVPFQFNAMFQDKFQIIEYLKNIRKAMQEMTHIPKGHISITAMDIPFFRQFGYKALSRFKLFFWQKSVLNLEQYRHKKFSADEVVEDFEDIVEDIYYYYHGIDSYEIWAPETLDTTIKQVQYYYDSGLFDSLEDAVKICHSLEDLLLKLEREAESGKKSILNAKGQLSGSFKIYQSDIFLSNNCIQAFMGPQVFTYITFNSFNHLMTYTPEFSHECSLWVDQLRSKSILLSEVSEKLRYQFFVHLRRKIINLRDNITSEPLKG
jgi:hypothetical protein